MSDLLEQYLHKNIPDRDEYISELEAYALEHRVPIMELAAIEMLLQLLRIQKPKRILEIGTAIGYSSLRMAENCPEAKIVTIERNEKRYEEARNFIQASKYAQQIKQIKGDALELEKKVAEEGPFDIIFIDAAKSQTDKFFKIYEKYLVEAGLIIIDNVLFRGLVYKEEAIIRRQRNLVKKLQDFTTELSKNENYNSVIIPIGDGVAICRKKERNINE